MNLASRSRVTCLNYDFADPHSERLGTIYLIGVLLRPGDGAVPERGPTSTADSAGLPLRR